MSAHFPYPAASSTTKVTPDKVDYAKAADEYGAKSSDSMRVMVNAALRKIKGAEDGSGDGGEAAPPTPIGKTATSNGRKRKGKGKDVAETQDDNEEFPAAKKRAMRGMPKEKAPAPREDSADLGGADSNEGVIKMEY